MTGPELNILAAMFARSNYGQPPAADTTVQWMRKHQPHSLSQAVDSLMSDVVEDDEQFGMFLDEAKSWAKSLKKKSELGAYQKSSPHVFAQFDRCAA